MRTTLGLWIRYGFPVLAVLLLAGGIGLCLILFWGGRDYWPLSIDYAYIYGAGKLWGENVAPYGDALPQAANAIAGRDLLPFVYPPNWYLPARLLALPDASTSNLIWLTIQLAVTLVGAWLIAASLQTFSHRYTPLARKLAPVDNGPVGTLWLAALFAGFVFASKGAGVGFNLGQTGLLAFFGQALMIYGVVRQRQLLVTIGLVILLLKPQLGLAYAFALMFDKRTRTSVIIAGGVTGLLALPGLMIGGPAFVLKEFIGGVSGYGARPENMPDAVSGLSNLLWRATGLSISAFAWLGVAAVVGLVGGLMLRKRIGAENGPLAMIITVTLAIGLFVPMHDWDFPLLLPLAALLFFLDSWALIFGALATLLLTRFVELLEAMGEDNWLAHQRISAMAVTVAILLATASLAMVLKNRRA